MICGASCSIEVSQLTFPDVRGKILKKIQNRGRPVMKAAISYSPQISDVFKNEVKGRACHDRDENWQLSDSVMIRGDTDKRGTNNIFPLPISDEHYQECKNGCNYAL